MTLNYDKMIETTELF